MLVTCKEGKLSNSSVPYSFRYLIILVIFIVFPLFMAKKDISPTINNVLFLLVGCEMASLDVINCAELTFLLPIMFD